MAKLLQNIKLVSTEMVNTPNLILWAVRGMTPSKARSFLHLVFPGVPLAGLQKLLKEDFYVIPNGEFDDVAIHKDDLCDQCKDHNCEFIQNSRL